MSNQQLIFKAISNVLGYSFDPQDLNLQATDFPGWDSLNHIRIIAEIETTFGITFIFSEIQALESVGDLVALTEKKII